MAERRQAELDRRVDDHLGNRADAEPVTMDEWLKQARSKQVVVLDTRPAGERLHYGQRPRGLPSIPIEFVNRVRSLPSALIMNSSVSSPVLGREDMK